MAELDCYPKLLLRNYRQWPSARAVSHKNFGIWNDYTWKDCYERVKYLSLGLVSLGLKPGDKVAIIGDEEPEVVWAICATQSARAIPVPLHSDSAAQELEYPLQHSESKFVIAEDQEQVDKMLQIKDKLPYLEKVIWWDGRGMRIYRDSLLISFDDVTKLGKWYGEERPSAFEDSIAHISGETIAQLVYTSGTTGLPKAVLIPHRALINIAQHWLNLFDIKPGDDVLSLFPSATVFEQWFAGLHYLGGAKLHFSEEPETVMEDLREISPKIMLIAPTQWLSLSSMIQVKVSDAGWMKRLVYNLFMPIGHKVADLALAKKRPRLVLRTLHVIGEWLVYRPLRDKIGLVNTRYPMTSSSFISPDVLRFFHAMDIKISQMYGSTEGGMDTAHRVDDIRIDTVGTPTLKTQVRIMDDGEILVRGDGIFSGYAKNPEATDKALAGGWYHTGDAGFFTPEGHLVYVDRAVDLHQLKSGYKFAPIYVEGRLKFSPYVAEAMAIGDEEKDYLSLIVVIDFGTVSKWAEQHRINYTTFVDLSQKDEVASLIGRVIARLNKRLPTQSRIRKYVLLHKELDPDDAELTRTRKLRRKFINEHYRSLIGAIYGNEEQFPVEVEVKYRDGRTGKISTSVRIRSVEEVV